MEMEAPKALAENPGGSADAKPPPVMIVLERAGDGTWVATPDYGGDEQAPAPSCAAAGVVGPEADHRLGNADTSPTSTRAHKIRLVRWEMACAIIDFKFDVKELIQDYFNVGLDPGTQTRRLEAMFRGDDERAREMLRLLFVGLLDGGDEPSDEAAAAAELLPPLQAVDSDDEPAGVEDEDSGDGEEEGPLRFAKKAVSAAGFVDARHMRMSVKAFFDPSIEVDDDANDDDVDAGFRAHFMSATGFVNRLWDVRRIIEVYMDDELDLETRRATMAKKLAELEEVLNARARAVSTGRIKFVQ